MNLDVLKDALLNTKRKSAIAAFSEFNNGRSHRYRLLKELSVCGAFSSIYLIREGCRDLIMKVVDTCNVSIQIDAREVKRYVEDEINAMIECSGHKNIMPLIDWYRYPIDPKKHAYVYLLIMPKLQESTHYFIENDFDPHAILKMAKDICDALTHCHAKKIRHRDIKPQNIFYSAETDSFVLSDFGSSRKWLSPMYSTFIGSGLTKDDCFFIAPEIRDQKVLGKCFNSDIYSLGKAVIVLLFRLTVLTDEIAYQSLNNLPPIIGNMLRKAIEDDPQKRYQTANEFGERLEKLLNGTAEEVSGKTPEKNLNKALLPECIAAFCKKDNALAKQKAQEGYRLGNQTLACLYAYLLFCEDQSRKGIESLRILEPMKKQNRAARGLCGLIHLHRGLKNNDDKIAAQAKEEFLSAAADGFSFAQGMVGRWYFYGENGFKEDAQKGVQLLMAASDQGFKTAGFYLRDALKRKPDHVSSSESLVSLLDEELKDFTKEKFPEQIFYALARQ